MFSACLCCGLEGRFTIFVVYSGVLSGRFTVVSSLVKYIK